MVQNEAKHTFRKLRLNTGIHPRPVTDSKPVPCLQPEQTDLYGSSRPQSDYGDYIAQVLSEISSADLLGTLSDVPYGEDSSLSNEQQRIPYGEDSRLQDSAGSRPDKLADSLEPSSVDTWRPSRRERGLSISFNSHATLDDGRQHSLHEPLPISNSGRRRTRAMSIEQREATLSDPSADASPRVNPFTGEIVRRRTRKSDATLPDRVDAIDGQDNVPPLTSAGTDSPYTEAVGTPISSAMSSSLLLSPGNMPSPGMSPIMATEPWPLSGRESIKSRILSRNSSLRNLSRRSSRMSASSPASAFLSQWGKDSLASIAPDPDDEGQTIGINGEYIIGRQIGYGGFSVVKELHSLSEAGEKIRQSVKIVRKTIPNVSETENDKQQQHIEHEVEVWRYCQHDHILPLRAVFDTEFATFCVMDLVEGGTLFDLVRRTRSTETKGLNLALAKHYAFQLATALRYLHEDIRMVHRDVKLENCLLDLTGDDAARWGGQLKLCDFGLAEFISGDTIFDSIESLDLNDADAEQVAGGLVGTLQYAAPEAFATTKQILQPSVDTWAFGVCLFAMITGDLPFRHSLAPKVIEMITGATWDRAAVRKAVAHKDDSEHILDLLEGCLEVDPNMRWTISDIMASPWFDDQQDAAADEWQMFSRP